MTHHSGKSLSMRAPTIHPRFGSGERSDPPGGGEVRRMPGRNSDDRRIAELEAQVAELEAFAGSVAHELRGPLRAINGFASILREEHAQELTGSAHSCVRTIIGAAREMERMIEDLLALSRTGTQPVAMSRVEARTLVKAALSDLLPEPDARVRFTIGELHDCLGHARLLRQVWTNLVSNALKFARERDPAEIEIGSSKTGTIVTYHVRDNGVGLDIDKARDLFMPFQRFHNARRYEGHGMGLAIVRRIIRRHGGRVWAEAHPGEGATFYFSLPGA